MNIQAIDTRHGTANQHSFSNGNCLPYTGVPFGMNFTPRKQLTKRQLVVSSRRSNISRLSSNASTKSLDG